MDNTLPQIVENYQNIELANSPDGELVLKFGDGIETLFAKQPVDFKYFNPQSLQGNPEKLNKYHGKFYFEHLDDVQEKLRVIPVCEYTRSRTLWEDDGKGSGGQVICRSFDGEYPAPTIHVPVSTQCGTLVQQTGAVLPTLKESCPKAKFGDDGSRPECQESRYIIFFDMDLMARIGVWIKGTALSSWNRFAKNHFKGMEQKKFIRRSQANQAKAKNIVYYMSLSPEKNRTAIVWEKDDEATAEEINQVHPVIEMYREYYFSKKDLIKSSPDEEPETVEAQHQDADVDVESKNAEQNLENFDMD